ncbi:MAG: ribonuclease D [Planctomycetales bacterium]|nr:ribonuclease D [Planctomycetales bacterium]
MQYDHITTDRQLQELCRDLADTSYIGFDTEFVSEDTYFPELCLVQVAADNILAVIDPKDISDMSPFWDVLSSGSHLTIAHAAREEFRFCRLAVQRRPANLFDVQLAAGLVGIEYPASYGKLLSKLLGVKLAKGETRTDWRRRPLSDKQIEYALQDVIYLKDIHSKLESSLRELGRLEWLDEEMAAWQDDMEAAESQERWRRVSGISGLPEKALVIVRELWRWREEVAQSKNRPPRRVLRDDLIVELARRGKSDVKQIRAIRGLERSVAKNQVPALSDAIERALELPRAEWPKPHRPKPSPRATLLGQFISTALSSICRSQQLAPSIVGTVQDVRDLVTYHVFADEVGELDEVPALAKGWRASIVGRTIEDLLEGKAVIRINDPKADEPLAIEPRR